MRDASAPRTSSHNDGNDHDHDELRDDVGDDKVADLTWQLEHVELTTVGIDIGSATSSVMFARILLERQSNSLSSRFRMVKRDVLHRSPIMLTPYLDDELIDAVGVRDLVDSTYTAAGLTETDVDTGVVILTGMALLRENAQALGELLADQAGRFVCAAAGHNLEALLAAHGAGAIDRSAEDRSRVVSLDVGGGTSKLTLVENGAAVATAAIVGGGRLLAWDEDHTLIRVEPVVVPIAQSAGFTPRVGEVITKDQVRAVAAAIAGRVADVLGGRAGPDNLLAGSLPGGTKPDLVLFSGGVAHHLSTSGEDAPGRLNDLGHELARHLESTLRAEGYLLELTASPITATVVGASQFSAQVSGNTVLITRPDLLPLRNLPVVTIDLSGHRDIDVAQVERAATASRSRLSLDGGDHRVAFAVRWSARPTYASLRALAEGILTAHNAHAPPDAALVVCIDADVAASLGAVLSEDLKVTASTVVLDGLELRELDFLDVGELIRPANVVPVLVKSLLFHGGAD